MRPILYIACSRCMGVEIARTLPVTTYTYKTHKEHSQLRQIARTEKGKFSQKSISKSTTIGVDKCFTRQAGIFYYNIKDIQVSVLQFGHQFSRMWLSIRTDLTSWSLWAAGHWQRSSIRLWWKMRSSYSFGSSSRPQLRAPFIHTVGEGKPPNCSIL
jgi:hypothetical protein